MAAARSPSAAAPAGVRTLLPALLLLSLALCACARQGALGSAGRRPHASGGSASSAAASAASVGKGRLLQTTPYPAVGEVPVYNRMTTQYPEWATDVTAQDLIDAGTASLTYDDSTYQPSDPATGWCTATAWCPPFIAPPFTMFNLDSNFTDMNAQLDQIEAKKVAAAAAYPQDTLASNPPIEVQWAAGNASYSGTSGYGNVPRYSRYYGIIYKNSTTGKWWTWINNGLMWPGADDWSTGYKSCKFTAPDPYSGFDCSSDDTCPGCDHCRGWGCFFNNHYPTYYNPTYNTNGRLTIPGKVYAQSMADAAQHPKKYGVCLNAGSTADHGCL